MARKTIDLRPMGADARDAAAALAAKEAEAAARKAAFAKESCIECGEFAPWCDGDFHYCPDHVPDELRHRGTHWRKGRT